MSSVRDEIKFGTDGWRGVISDNFTFKNVRIVAQAISEWVRSGNTGKETEERKVAVGYDARFLSKEYAQSVACVLAANDIKVYLSSERIPTPALSYGVVNIKGTCGIMITASHNPAQFNGIKIKTSQGGGAGKNITNKVEEYLGKSQILTVDPDEATKDGRIKIHDFNKAYLKFMKSYVDFNKIKKAKFRIIQDVMHGSGQGILEQVLK